MDFDALFWRQKRLLLVDVSRMKVFDVRVITEYHSRGNLLDTRDLYMTLSFLLNIFITRYILSLDHNLLKSNYLNLSFLLLFKMCDTQQNFNLVRTYDYSYLY